MPVGIFHLEDWPERLNAGVSKEDVDPAEIMLYLCGRGAKAREVALIDDEALPLAASLLDELPSFV
jgi:hypothetical protein